MNVSLANIWHEMSAQVLGHKQTPTNCLDCMVSDRQTKKVKRKKNLKKNSLSNCLMKKK